MTSGFEQLRSMCTHACVSVPVKYHPVAFPGQDVTDRYSDAEYESHNTDGMTWGRSTRKENGESSLKRNINK